MSDFFYIYGLTRATDSVTVTTPAVFESDNQILMIATGDYSVIASRISVKDVDSTRRNMMAHTRVLERAMEQATVLPMRFGMIVSDKATLDARVARHARRLAAALIDIEGRIEVGVKIAFAEGVATAEVSEERTDLRRMSEALNKRNPNETYYDRIDLGREVEAALSNKRLKQGERVAALLRPLSAKMEKLGISDDNGICNLAFLIDRAAEPAFAKAIEMLDLEKPGRFIIRYVAPVPAYNFVRISLDAEPQKDAA